MTHQNGNDSRWYVFFYYTDIFRQQQEQFSTIVSSLESKHPFTYIKYIAIYSNKVIVNFEIQAAKYLQIQATSKTKSTTRNVYSTIHATVYKMSGIQEHVLSPRGLYYSKRLKKGFFFLFFNAL